MGEEGAGEHGQIVVKEVAVKQPVDGILLVAVKEVVLDGSAHRSGSIYEL